MMPGKAVTMQLVEIVTILQLFSGVGGRGRRGRGRRLGMKKYIREMINDLKNSRAKDFIPAVPKGSKENPVVDLTPPPGVAVPDDLSNQVLSKNAEEKVKQLDYQAFESERLQTDE
jgi:hypothetical protein